MARPNIAYAQMLPVVSYSDWDNVNVVKNAIRQLENGIFDAAAQVVDSMGRDDRITGVMSTRAGALPSLPFQMDPRGDGRQKTPVSKEASEGFEQWYPDYALSELMHWGIMLGVGIGQLKWTLGERRWTHQLHVWHPKFIRWRWDTNSFWVSTMNGETEVTPGDGQWVLFTPYGAMRGWMQGRVRSLYVPWLVRQWALRDWARYSEVHGMPIRKAVTPTGAQGDDKARFLQEVANIGTESIIRTPRVPGEGDDNRYDIELVEALGRSTETFEKLIDKADTCVAIALLGQNLTTEVKGGSYAATMGHLQIRNDILQADAQRLAQCLRSQALSHWAKYNHGDEELAPTPNWKTQPPEDKVQKGAALKNLGEGIVAIQATGAKPDVDALLEEHEVPTTGPAQDPPAPTPSPAAGSPAASGKPPPAGRKTLPRPNVPAAKASIAALADDAKVPMAAIEGQAYVDDVISEGIKAASAELSGDLSKLLAVVEAAEDFEGLRKELLRVYGAMSSKAMGKLLQDALVLSELAGRFAVSRELGESISEED